ncbi:DUF6252 family protein [Hymenobacter sp. ASUV-10]|uniref:DUF6252 family protein n=1 Tax=Hymenobacter aranciens TaxID=3063996 RepID=A0ABT9BL75_9BACT|nr:DUF6252 family protein [Hymenobacter sp. ASUV-10]MDO7877752.1 DUF6252 family protein [Hymenobacter sp. ASUV-10]
MKTPATARFATLLLLATACTNNTTSDPEPVRGMHWTENGSTITAYRTMAAYYNNGARNMYVVGLMTTGADTNSVQLTVPRHTGTFVLDSSNQEFVETLSWVNNRIGRMRATYYGGSGRIIVSHYDSSGTAGASRIAGTFEFVAKGSDGSHQTVRDGWFDVNY